jgi:hypothetical protein
MAVVTSSGDVLTLADLEAMPGHGRRYELIGGAIVITPRPVPLRQLVSSRLHRLVEGAVPEGHVVFDAPIDRLRTRTQATPPLVVHRPILHRIGVRSRVRGWR